LDPLPVQKEKERKEKGLNEFASIAEIKEKKPTQTVFRN